MCPGFGINASGEVVGHSYLDKVFFFKCGKHTCRFTQNDPFSRTAGAMTDLGAFSTTAMSEAIALNNLIPPGSGFTLDSATTINDNGQTSPAAPTPKARSTRSCSPS